MCQRPTAAVLALGILSLAACASRPATQARFLPSWYEVQQPTTKKVAAPGPAYRIDYLEARQRTLMPAGWRVLGYVMDGGLPTTPFDKGENVVEIPWIDSEGGQVVLTGLAYDLRLSHDASNGIVGVRLMPMDAESRGRPARVVAESWVNGLNGTVSEVALSRWSVRSHRMATRIVASDTVTVGDAPAHAVTFESVDLDQLQLDPRAPRVMGRLILVDALVRKRLDRSSTSIHRDVSVPARLALLYVNDAASYPSGLPAFESLVARVHPGR